jgi:hypothetical protein
MFRFLSSNRRFEILIIGVVILSCFSYPITAVLIAFLKLPSNSINIGLKFIYLVIYLIALIIGFKKSNGRVPKTTLFILIFFLIYSFRLIVDNSILGIHFIGGGPFYVYSYYFGATLIPALAIVFGIKYISYKKLFSGLFFTLLLAGICILWFVVSMGAKDILSILTTRAEVNSEGNDPRTGILINPIMIAHYGSALGIVSASGLLLGLFKNVFTKILAALGFTLGIFNLIIGASRGPFFFFILLLLFLIFYYILKSKKTLKFTAGLLLWPVSLFVVFNIFIVQRLSIKFEEIHLVKRLNIFSKQRTVGSKEYRDYSYVSSWNDFLDSPAIGKQFVGTFDNSYPHNIILESFMATGIVGGLLLVISIVLMILKLVKLLNINIGNYKFAIILLTTEAFLLGLTSGSIFANPEVWISLVFFLAIPLTYSNNQNKLA